jgi:hypothetical protein
MARKSKGFNRIRKLAAASSLGVAGLLGGGFSARAATTAIPFSLTRGGAYWYGIGNSFGDHSFAAATLLLCTTTTHCSTNTNGIPVGSEPFGITSATTGSRSDAFDSMLGMSVDGAAFVAPGGVVDLTGDTVFAGPVSLSGLSTDVRYEFFSNRPAVRALYSFANPSGSPIDATVVIGGEYGSDDDAIVQDTSSGDAVITAADGWYVTSDGTPPGSDPDITVSRFGGGASIMPTTVNVPGSGANDYFTESFDISVPPGGTCRIAFFVELSSSVENAVANAPDFDDLTSMSLAGLLDGLTSEEINQIVNIHPEAGCEGAGPGPAPREVPVPLLSAPAKISLAALLALLGTITMRRYRRREEATKA